jgi:hypothetical protein
MAIKAKALILLITIIGCGFLITKPTFAESDTIPPKIEDVRVTDMATNTAVVRWTTSEPSTGQVDYGQTDKLGTSQTDELVTDHKLTLSAKLSPAHTYYFKVSSTDSAGNKSSSAVRTFKTVGFHLSVKVTNQNLKAVSGVKVSFGATSGLTNKQGVAEFSDLSPGRHEGSLIYRNHVKDIAVDITERNPGEAAQEEVYKIDFPQTHWLIIIGLIILAGAAIFRSDIQKMIERDS